MKLIALPGANGIPEIWVEATQLASIVPIYRKQPSGVRADIDVHIHAMPTHRLLLGEYPDRDTAVASVHQWMEQLQDGLIQQPTRQSCLHKRARVSGRIRYR